jgi:hypothetical protein
LKIVHQNKHNQNLLALMVEKVHKFSSHCPGVCFGIGKEEKPMRVEKENFHT